MCKVVVRKTSRGDKQDEVMKSSIADISTNIIVILELWFYIKSSCKQIYKFLYVLHRHNDSTWDFNGAIFKTIGDYFISVSVTELSEALAFNELNCSCWEGLSLPTDSFNRDLILAYRVIPVHSVT